MNARTPGVLVVALAALAFSLPSVRGETPDSTVPKVTTLADVKKNGWSPFRGTLSSVDSAAKTFTVRGKTAQYVFTVTQSTKITKRGKPATLRDAVAGDDVGGMTTIASDGKLLAVSVWLGRDPGYPAGIPIVGKTGFVKSPYAPSAGSIDIRGRSRGDAVRDPFTGKIFQVP